MDNTDRAQASIDELVQGDYVFKLTVYDAENLHSSINVTVGVRDRKCVLWFVILYNKMLYVDG